MYYTTRAGNNLKTLSVDLPHELEAMIWLDPGDTDYVTLNGGDVSELKPKIGAGMVVSQPTASQQPLYNTPSPTFASGRNSMTFDRSANQELTNLLSSPLIASLNGVSPWTLCVVASYVDVSLGGTAFAIYDVDEGLAYISPYEPTTGRVQARYSSALDGLTFAQNHPAELVQNGVPCWMMMRFDGVDTIGIETSYSTGEDTATGAGDTSPVGLDALSIGRLPALGGHEGEVGDFVAFDRNLNATDRAAMITWLESRL
jgi:hypothetical protein